MFTEIQKLGRVEQKDKTDEIDKMDKIDKIDKIDEERISVPLFCFTIKKNKTNY